MLHAQNNNSCQTAAILNPVLECNSPQTFVFGNGQTEQWFSFTINNNINTLYSFFSIQNYFTGNNSINSMELFSGNCGMLNLLSSEIIPFGDSTLLSLFDSLNNNSTYFIKVSRLNSTINESFALCLQTSPEAEQFSVELNGNICQPLNPSSCNSPTVKQCPNFYTACLEEELVFKPDAYYQNSLGDFVEWRIADNNYNIIYGPYVTTYNGQSLDSFLMIPSLIPLSAGNSYWVVASYYNHLPNFGYYCFWTEIQMSIHIADKPFPAFTINPPPPYCINQQIQLTDNTINHPSGIDMWDMGDGGSAYGYGSASYTYITPGIYTITYTKSNVCGENTITQEIEVGPYPKFEVPEPLCAGQEFTFNNTTACLQYVQSWFWDFGDGFSSTQANPSHTYTNQGIYTVTLCLTDANGQQHCITQSVVVHPSPAPPVILGNLFVCDPVSEYCVQNPQPDYTYWWNITNGFPQSYSGPCVEVNWNQNGSGFLTVMATNEFGCIAVTDKEVAECCYKEDLNNPGTEINLYNTSASFIINNILGGSSTWTTNTYINLNGVMEIDQNFTFSNCPNIYLGQNARINIPAGKKLRIENASKLEAACPDKMWDGIYLQTFTSQLEADFSTFKQAQQAVVSQNGATYTITATTFDQNWIGIKVEPFPFNHPGIVTAGAFGPTRFLCTTPLMYPHLTKRSHAGVFIERVGNQNGNITIGSSLLFDNQNTGILADQSYLTVIGNTFQHMGIAQGQGGGVGVHALGGKFSTQTLVGGANANQNNFNNCFIGVLIEGWQQAEVSHNTFNSSNNVGGTGIYVKNVTNINIPIPYKDVTIAQNQLNNYQTGINLYSNMNAKVNVFKNNINQQGISFGTGIIAQEMPISITFNLTIITDNNITAPTTGISAGGLRNALIENNSISKLKQFPLFNTYGVLLRACFGARVKDNTVSSQNPSTNTRQHGYAFEMSEATFATCNEADKTGTGMRCAGMMPNSFLLGNTFKNNYYGFTMSNNAIIGEQYRMVQGTKYPSDNRWQGNFNSRSYANATTNPDKNLSPFNVRSISGNNPFYPNAGVLPTDTLARILLVKNPPLKCNEIDIHGIKKGLSQQIAKKQVPINDTASVIGRMQVFEALQQNYTWQPDTILAQFADSMQNTSYRTLQLIDSVMFDTAQCNASLLSTCQGVVSYNHVEQHIQTATEIYISSRVSNNGIYTPQQINELENIAWLCPFEDGKGVYLARFLLHEVSTQDYINNCETQQNNNLRVASQEQQNNAEEIETIQGLTIYPNPANESINITAEKEVEMLVELYNLLGQQVYSGKQKSRQTSVNTALFPSGLYLVKVYVNGTEITNEKISIQH
ncbi:MAG: hypothetical protein HJHJAOHD_00575 [Flavobacteriales bacterium]|nr:hypothetical protein [Flavobacteriales bacterium]